MRIHETQAKHQRTHTHNTQHETTEFFFTWVKGKSKLNWCCTRIKNIKSTINTINLKKRKMTNNFKTFTRRTPSIQIDVLTKNRNKFEGIYGEGLSEVPYMI